MGHSAQETVVVKEGQVRACPARFRINSADFAIASARHLV